MKNHWRNFHNPDYIGAYAFQPGERKVVMITSVAQEQVKSQRGSEDCLVVHFADGVKPLICNVTNSKAIQKVTGSGYIEDWVGQKVELYVTEVSAFGETMEAVRVKPTPPVLGKPKLNENHTAWAKVIEGVRDGYTRSQVEKKYSISDQVWEKINQQAKEENENGES